MNILELKGETGKSKILFGESINNVLNYTENKKLFIITDTNVNRIYKEDFPDGLVFVIRTGESIKTYETINLIYTELIKKGYDRTSFILGIGGGVVCDIAGFVASTYMRGVNFGFVPTTLLAQVDASIGGKNGINFGEYKNMIGTFNQPDFILMDFSLLKTLTFDEFKNGIAESIKHALINDLELVKILIQNNKKICNYDLVAIEEIIIRSVKVKLNIVKKDETEKNERKKLNFGHTLGHGVELLNDISHGKAVSIGIAFASAISLKYGYITKGVYVKILNLLKLYELPVKTKLPAGQLIEKISKDKKKQGNLVNFILLRGMGDVFIKKIDLEELQELLNDLC